MLSREFKIGPTQTPASPRDIYKSTAMAMVLRAALLFTPRASSNDDRNSYILSGCSLTAHAKKNPHESRGGTLETSKNFPTSVVSTITVLELQ